MRKRLLGIATMLPVVATMGVALPAASAEAAPTDFAYSGTAFGNNARSTTDPNLGSGRTVLAVLGCTVNVPEQDTNQAATTQQNGVPLTTSTVRTYSKSKQVSGGFATASRSRVESVNVGSTTLGSLAINGLDVIATAAFRNGNAAPTTSLDVTNATLRLPGQDPVPLELDDLRDGVDIPGVADVRLGEGRTTSGPNSATANVTGLHIDFDDGTRASVAVANARIDKVVGRGPFSGGASVGRGTVGTDGSRIGPVLERPMPCRGTGGRWLSEELARGSSGDDFRARDARVRVFTRKFGTGAAVAKSEGSANRASALDGDLQATNIVAAVSVLRREDGSYAKSIEGTQVGNVRYQGENVDVPDPGETTEIPGVARFRTAIVGSGPGSRSVIALRIELLDGSGTIIDVARARAKVG